MQPIDSIETYAYGTSKDLPTEKVVIKCNNIIKKHKYFDGIPKKTYKYIIQFGSKYFFISSGY